MGNSVIDFLGKIVCEIPIIKQTIDDCTVLWLPDEPPIIYLFGEVGESIINELLNDHKKSFKLCFDIIEDGLTNLGNLIRTAVATGMIEAMVAKSDNDLQLWTRLEKLFGPESKKHALAWRSFGG